MPERKPESLRTAPSTVLRVYLLGFFMLGGLGALSAKLWHEQVTRSQKWKDKIKKGTEVTVRIPSIRGEIRDRNGIALVTNRASYGVDFYLPQMVLGYKQQNNGEVPKALYRTTINGMPKNVQVADIVDIVKTTVIPKLDELDVAADFQTENPLDFSASKLERHYRTNDQVPYKYLEDIQFTTLAKFSESDLGLPGVEVTQRPVRQYVYGSMAAHLLGYVGDPQDIDKLADAKEFNYYQPEVEGKSQVELYLDKYIRGKPGKRILERNAKGRIGTEKERIPPTPGNHVYLTIDARIQYIAEKALRDAEVGRGAAVVMNPNNGDILAMASVPSYDPNLFIPKIPEAEWDKMDADETDPLINRAIQSYAPGSTYKILTALAGLKAGIPASRVYNCDGGVTYGNTYMKCWIGQKGGRHGALDLLGAIKNSCNCYFFQDANDAKLPALEAVGNAIGMGEKSGLPLSGESPGILPGLKYLALQGRSAQATSKGHIANSSIGQGEVLASPLQIAMLCSTVANGGTAYYPRLIHRVVDKDGNDVADENGQLVAPLQPKIRGSLLDAGVKADQIEVVRRGMWKVVNEAGGTGKKAAIKGVEVAGKTGTAQFWRKKGNENIKDNHVWFMCFAPYKEPRYAIAIMIQGAKSGGGVAAPVAQRILKESLALDAGYSPAIAWLDPAPGSFKQIEAISFKEDGSLTKLVAQNENDTRPGAGGEEEETADHVAEPGNVSETNKKDSARPDIRENADERGRVSKKPFIEKKPNLWQKMFGPRKQSTKPQPTGVPGRGR